MRTDVLTHSQVTRILARDYVCAWQSTEDDETCGSSYCHSPSDPPLECAVGNGEHNTQLCVFTADRRLLLVMAGYQNAGLLYGLLTYAERDLRTIAEDARLTEEQRKEKLKRTLERDSRESHRDAVKDVAFLSKHVLEPWSAFSVAELVEGRGFGEGFFGSIADVMPEGLLGNVPAGRTLDLTIMKLERTDNLILQDSEVDALVKKIGTLRKDARTASEARKPALIEEIKSNEAEISRLVNRLIREKKKD